MSTQNPDQMLVVRGFRVEITGADGKHSEDTAMEEGEGGALCIGIGDSSNGSDQEVQEGPRPKSVTEIVLRGPMTKTRKWIAENINDTMAGRPGRFDLTLVEIMKDGSDGKRYSYSECFITRYVYPKLSAEGHGNLYEEVSIKPERLTIQ